MFSLVAGSLFSVSHKSIESTPPETMSDKTDMSADGRSEDEHAPPPPVSDHREKQDFYGAAEEGIAATDR